MAAGYSFVIPAYNDAEGLRRHLRYFSDCPEQVQLVVVDDCSQDDTPQVMESAALPKNVRLTYHRMEQNAGPATARNKGIELAEEDWLLFLDADDLLAPLFFQVMGCLPDNPDFDFAMFKHHMSLSAHERYTYNMHPVDRRFFSNRAMVRFPYDYYRLHNCPEAMATVNFPWNKLYRRAFLLDAGIQFPDLRMHEDIAPHWQSFLRCESFAVLGWAPPLITHYEIPSSGRATQYVGEKRMSIFPELARVEDEIRAHAYSDKLGPVFAEFCNDIFAWLIGGLCDQGGPDGDIWRPRYRDALTEFSTQSRLLKEVDER